MDTEWPQQQHGWESHRLAAQILRAWVREKTASLPAWTTPGIVCAYAHLLESLEALIAATQHAEREERRRG